jgi:vacuolar-type H+-ATPase subunit B/Vma2
MIMVFRSNRDKTHNLPVHTQRISTKGQVCLSDRRTADDYQLPVEILLSLQRLDGGDGRSR